MYNTLINLMPVLQSLVPGACKQGIKSKARALKGCKEKDSFPVMSGVTLHCNSIQIFQILFSSLIHGRIEYELCFNNWMDAKLKFLTKKNSFQNCRINFFKVQSTLWRKLSSKLDLNQAMTDIAGKAQSVFFSTLI